MKERLLSQPTPTDSLDMERLDGTGTPIKEHLHNDYPAHTNPGHIPDPPEMPPDSLIGTVVKVIIHLWTLCCYQQVVLGLNYLGQTKSTILHLTQI